MAAAAGKDHRDYLLELIGPPRKIDTRTQGDDWNHGEDPERYPIDTARLRQVIEVAHAQAGWGRSMPKGSGLGLAATYTFVTYVAAVAQVEVDASGNVRVPRIDMAVDCGAVVNPERIESQIEGAAVMGMGVAMFNEISFKNGRVEQGNLNEFDLARISTSPVDIRVHIMPGDYSRPLGGVGEPAVPPIAPAICNAIFAATGKRIRPTADARPAEDVSARRRSFCRVGPPSCKIRLDQAPAKRSTPIVALQNQGVAAAEVNEVVSILYSMKGDVLRA